MTTRFTRPPTPPGFDPSRAAERAADPSRWRYDDARLQAVYDVIAERRDVRRFRPDEVDDDVLQRVLTAAHQAPSVGLMQPWRLIVIRDERTRSEIRALAQRERLRQADQFDARARHFLDQKIEGVVEAPVGVCVCCDHGPEQSVILGRTVGGGEERVLYGQRVDGVVRVTDVPAHGRGRAYLVERGLEHDGYAALKALVADYVQQAELLADVPMAIGPLGSEAGEEVAP